MGNFDVAPLRPDLCFGVRIRGVTRQLLEFAAVRAQLAVIFEDKGLIVFEDVEPTSHMQVALSEVFGPLKEHPNRGVPRVDGAAGPGVIDMYSGAGNEGVVEIDGRRMAQWLPWHFDHCYNDELNRGGVLRAIEIAPEGGMTGFADGVHLYQALSAQLRERIENRRILYKMDVVYATMRFGRPAGFVEVVSKPGARAVMEDARGTPRALHPAVWTRKSGEKVLHVSPWMAQGIEGMENAEGDALLEAVCQEINAKARAYHHQWRLSDMLIWDNWRMLHSVTGVTPGVSRRMQRTTIKGDYGLGCFESRAA